MNKPRNHSVLLLLVLFAALGFVPRQKNLQNQNTGFQISNADSLTIAFDKELKQYVSSFGYRPVLNKQLSGLADQRAAYFISLLTAPNTQSVEQLINAIPHNKSAHGRNFGNPEIYPEPAGIVYPELFKKFAEIKRSVRSEIMQQHLWQFSSWKEYSDKELISKALTAFSADPAQGFILSRYKTSPDHKAIIDSCANGFYGCVTKIGIRREHKEGSNEYAYMVIAFNLAVFSQPLK